MASLIRADVSWQSLVQTHVTQVLEENAAAEDSPPPGKLKKVSTTDPEASLATTNQGQRMEPSYKQHTAVDDRAGVIVDVAVTTGETNEGKELLGQLGRVTEQTGQAPQAVTADGGYASSANYAALEEAGVRAVIPPPPERTPHRGVPLARFSYDARHHQVHCPAGKLLARGNRDRHGWWYRARAADCQRCAWRARCLAPTARVRSVYIREGYPALLRARRRKAQGWSEALRQAYRRHRWRVEGVHGEAKTQHGLRRAVRRGLSNLRIQAYLTAAVINLKRLVTHGAGLPARLVAALLARHQYRRAARRTRRCAFAC
jgi:IS5 family transposase